MRFLFLTANVGSLFEESSAIEQSWMTHVTSLFQSCQPDFFALHFQEIGGKNYKVLMPRVVDFLKHLHKSLSDSLGRTLLGRAFVDSNFELEDQFTALCSLYLFSHHLREHVELFSFAEDEFHTLSNFAVTSKNLHTVPQLTKHKFQRDSFPSTKFSRKGYMRTRWRLYRRCVFELVNVHLFHDSCNVSAAKSVPSGYSENRRAGLQAMCNQLQFSERRWPIFVFGDFNFRLSLEGVIHLLTRKSPADAPRSELNSDGTISYYHSANNSSPVLQLGSKQFQLESETATKTLFVDNYRSLLSFDREVTGLRLNLYEVPIDFPPSYPYSEDCSSALTFMPTRCPAWCDRVLMNRAAFDLVGGDSSYCSLGRDSVVGDHKPVYLSFQVAESQLNNGDARVDDACSTHEEEQRFVTRVCISDGAASLVHSVVDSTGDS